MSRAILTDIGSGGECSGNLKGARLLRARFDGFFVLTRAIQFAPYHHYMYMGHSSCSTVGIPNGGFAQ